MPAAPDAIFIIDTHEEHVAASEALTAGIPTVGITDTNADPTIIDYPIPANDDAVGSIKLITDYIFDAWIEGRKNPIKQEEEAAKEEENVESSSTKARKEREKRSKRKKQKRRN